MCQRPQPPDDRLLAPPPAFTPMAFGMSDPEAAAVEVANNQAARLLRERHTELQRYVREVVLK